MPEGWVYLLEDPVLRPIENGKFEVRKETPNCYLVSIARLHSLCGPTPFISPDQIVCALTLVHMIGCWCWKSHL